MSRLEDVSHSVFPLEEMASLVNEIFFISPKLELGVSVFCGLPDFSFFLFLLNTLLVRHPNTNDFGVLGFKGFQQVLDDLTNQTNSNFQPTPNFAQ